MARFNFGAGLPVLAAPMAGGPGTPALVIAAARAGSLGFIAGGYKSPDELAAQLDAVSDAGANCGVNLFAPNPEPVNLAAFRRYAQLMRAEASRYQLTLDDQTPVEDDDRWADKIDLLRAHPVPVISFTFGLPPVSDLRALRPTGALLMQTVTSPAEAKAAEEAGLDALAVQSAQAGGHSGTFTPRSPVAALAAADLVAAVRQVTALPILAAGGIAEPADAGAALRAGADAVAVGTALLLADEAGTSATHRAALTDPARPGTVITHAFTGRPARGLRNAFIDAYEPVAPYGYPALHHLTSGIRKAAAAAGDPERVHLWAGTGYRHAIPGPAAAILTALSAGALGGTGPAWPTIAAGGAYRADCREAVLDDGAPPSRGGRPMTTEPARDTQATRPDVAVPAGEPAGQAVQEPRFEPGPAATPAPATSAVPTAPSTPAVPTAPSTPAEPTAPSTQAEPARPAAPQHVVKRTRIGGVWVAAALFAVVLLLLLIFILQNGHHVAISFFGAQGHLPLGVALLLAAVLGVLLVVIPGTGRIMQLRMTARRHRRTDAGAGGNQAGR
ncbi:MAG TPA: lipopolysaccharide assembly protein LapA domain-containing protein [Streptosporangiaceae bacterium]